MPITHPALPRKPPTYKLTLSCGHFVVYTGKIDDPARPVFCHHSAHGADELGLMVSIVALEVVG